MSYSKGDWKIKKHGITSVIYIETPNKAVSKEYVVAEGIYNQANAQLIAAAPKLLEACKEIASNLSLGSSVNYLYKHNLSLPLSKLQKAIAEAGGK